MTAVAIVLVIGALWFVIALGVFAAFYVVGPLAFVLGLLLVAGAFAFLVAGSLEEPAPTVVRRRS